MRNEVQMWKQMPEMPPICPLSLWGRVGAPLEKGERLFQGNPGWGQQITREAANYYSSIKPLSPRVTSTSRFSTRTAPPSVKTTGDTSDLPCRFT